ncbi:MAG: hypothetical protein WB384_09125, partial [Candidatus Sulfotelmatobacter sp.]
FIPRYSFVAAAVATVATEFVLLAQNAYLVRRKTGSLPFPAHSLPLTLMFAGALSLAWMAGKVFPFYVTGTLAAASFSLYVWWLYRRQGVRLAF